MHTSGRDCRTAGGSIRSPLPARVRARRVPKLASETAERRFWESHDSLIKIWLEEKLSA
jgi:hypothetical protein